MIDPILLSGLLSGELTTTASGGEFPLVWHGRLDDPEIADLATQAPLDAADLRDLALRPQSGVRATRRRLTKLLLARRANCHPDTVVIARSSIGAPLVVEPAGWHVSVAGQWPQCAIALDTAPIGIDIEPLDAPPPPDDTMTEMERATLAGASSRDRLAHWVAKEAHAKRFGVAARIDPRDIAITPCGRHWDASSPDGKSQIALWETGDALVAIAR